MANRLEPSRRRFVAAGVGGVSAVLFGCGDSDAAEEVAGGTGGDDTTSGSSGDGGSGGNAGGVSSQGGSGSSADTCTLYPQQTEGPYYVEGELLRADIREGKAGARLSLSLLVVRADGCTPLAGVPVDIWHCDAAGVYSGFTGQLGGLDTTGQVFLRGTQVTGADGRVSFETIYPGWYPGRTTHIHFKVHPTATTEATSQLYFAEDTNTEVYATAPYAARGQKDTSNAADGIAGAVPLMTVTKKGADYQGSITVAVAA